LQNGKNFHRYFYGLILNYESLQDAVEASKIPEEAIDEYEKEFLNANYKILYVCQKMTSFDSEKSQIKAGDIIWKIDGELIGPNLRRIDEIVQEKQGKPISMIVYRDGKKQEVEIPTFEVNSSAQYKLLNFAGTMFMETTNDIRMEYGKMVPAVYIIDSEEGTPFAQITSPENANYSHGIIQIISINQTKIQNLKDMKEVIKDLYKRKSNIFEVRFMRLGYDTQEYSVLVKYVPEFVSATMYVYNQETHKWITEVIENPKQQR
jgi:C-terminal processing protease CtpA/Prc